MRVEPFNLKEFGTGAVNVKPQVPAAAAAMKPLLSSKRKDGLPPPPPTYNEEQLKAAERESYKKGFNDGVKEGRVQQQNEQGALERNLYASIEHFAMSLAPVLTHYREIVMQLKQEMPRVAMAIARKAAGNALADNAQALIDDIALRCAEIMIGEPKLLVVVHTSVADLLKQKLAALTEKLQTTTDIVVIGDATIPEADCRIEWKQGSFARDNLQLWHSIEQAVAGMVAASRHDGAAQSSAVINQSRVILNHPSPKE